MHDQRLQIYLNDHLALIIGEMELVARCVANDQSDALTSFLKQLQASLQDERSIMHELLARIGGSENRAKQGAAWFAEKLGRLKLNGSLVTYSPLSRVVELEALIAAAVERTALWDTLAVVLDQDARINGIDCATFRDNAEKHLLALHQHRRAAALEAFRS